MHLLYESGIIPVLRYNIESHFLNVYGLCYVYASK